MQVRALRSLTRNQRGNLTVEFLLGTMMAVALLAAIIGQVAIVALGVVACESAARDAAVAAARGNDPVLAARKAAPDWEVTVSSPVRVRESSYSGVRVSVTLKVPALPIRMLADRGFTITRTATMPDETG